MERVATTYAKIAGLVPGRLQPKLPGMFPEDGQVTPSSPPPFLQYAHGTVRVRLHLLTGLWLAASLRPKFAQRITPSPAVDSTADSNRHVVRLYIARSYAPLELAFA